MQEQHAIAIYNASAGSGKTFALVCNYLTILLRSSGAFKFRQILAITFTNKAVAEMKSRIVESLKDFAHSENSKRSAMMLAVQNTTGMEFDAIKEKSVRILHHIVQDYASFDVVTIDNFTHRIIRTFARDLKIPQNFEVELNTSEVLELAVDNLIDQAGEDPVLTRILLDYAMEKIDDDKSWDISRDLYDIAKLLLSENDRNYVAVLNKKTLKDFAGLKKHLEKKNAQHTETIKTDATDLLAYFENQGLSEEHFKGKYLPKALIKFQAGDFSYNPNTAWVQHLGDEPLYTKTQKEFIKDILDTHAAEITTRFRKIQQEIAQLLLINEFLKKITPLSLLQAIYTEVQKIKSEKNLLLISDFNEVINQNIANQPTPFIYERLGERYQHYFIDEFQDTSILQWQNLIPLIDNAVSTGERQEPSNSLMLVGDPKQAIYRWRGGYAEQFIDLAAGKNPFQNRDFALINLESNYRSFTEIIGFNNTFFSHTAHFLDQSLYKNIYTQGNNQLSNHKKGGFVSISFVEANTAEEAQPFYLEKTVEVLREVLKKGFAMRDICILVRKNGEGILLAQYLQEQKIPVISSQSLLVSQSVEVQFVVNVMRFMQQPTAQAISIFLLEYLAIEHFKLEDPHTFYSQMLPLQGQRLFDALDLNEIPFNVNRFTQLPLYEGVEYLIQYFQLNKNGGAYLQFFLDAVYDFIGNNESGMHGFLLWWEKNADKLSISTPPNTEAVQIMTIHKAKGLEFPVVVYPFAESAIYPTTDSINWYVSDGEDYAGFKALLISQKKGLLDLDDTAAALYYAKRQQQQLDNLNLLYVALTRPVEQLYIISKKTDRTKPTDNPTTFADLFINYLEDIKLWAEDKTEYCFGNSEKISESKKVQNSDEILNLHSSTKESHNLVIVTRAERLWDENIQESINKGNLMHDLLAEMRHKKDIDQVLKKAEISGLLKSTEWDAFRKQLQQLIGDLQEEGFFDAAHTVYNERELLYQGRLLRPDRVEINSDGNAYLLDYKTGIPQEHYKAQLNEYTIALEATGIKVVKKILVYTNEKESIHSF